MIRALVLGLSLLLASVCPGDAAWHSVLQVVVGSAPATNVLLADTGVAILVDTGVKLLVQ